MSTPLIIISRILRWTSLAILSAGSAAIVFAAITLVKAAQANGIPVSQAATANAPLFIHFSKVMLGGGIALLLGESLDYAWHRSLNKSLVARYASSLLCIAATMIFAFAIVPPMQELLPQLASNVQAHAEFDRLHQLSRTIFSIVILLAVVSLVIPAFEPPAKTP